MAAVVASSASQTNSAHVAPKPSGLAVGDLLVVAMFTFGWNSDTLSRTGWTLVPNGQAIYDPSGTGTSDDIVVTLLWKIADAADVAAASYFFTNTAGGYTDACTWRITGHDPTTPIDAAANTNGTGTAAAAPSVTTTVENTLLLIAHGAFTGALSVPYPGFYRDQFFDGANYGFSRPWEPTGATGTFAATEAASDTFAIVTCAIRPASQPTISHRRIGSTFNLNTQASTPLTTTVTAEVGTTILVRVAANNSGTNGAAPTLGVTDSAGNTYTQIGSTALADPGAANLGVAEYLFAAPVTTQLASGGTITVSFNPSTSGRSIIAERWRGLNNASLVAVASTALTGTTPGTAPTGSRTPTAAGQLVYVHLGVEGPAADTFTTDTDTTDGRWEVLDPVSTTSATADNNVTTKGQYKVVTGTTAQSWAATITSRDWAGAIVVLAAAPPGVTGTAASTLPAFTQTAAGTRTLPTSTGTAASVLPAFTQAAAGTRTVPVFTGTAGSPVPAFTQAAAGTHVPPTFTGTAASTLPAFTQTAAGTHTIPTRTGTAASTLPPFTQAAAGTRTVPVFTGDAAQTLAAFTQAAAGTAAPPTFTGTAAQQLPPFTQTAAGTHAAPVFTGTAASGLPAFTQEAVGTAEAEYTGTAASVLPAFTQAAEGTRTVPAGTGTAESVLPAFTQTATGTRTVPVVTGTGASSVPAFTQAAVGAVVAPVFTGTAAQQLPPFTQASSGTHTAPVFVAVTSSQLAAFTQTAAGTFTVGVLDVPGHVTLHDRAAGVTLHDRAATVTLTDRAAHVTLTDRAATATLDDTAAEVALTVGGP